MIQYSLILLMVSVLFMISNRLQQGETKSQKLYYYAGGLSGLLYFSYLLYISANHYDFNVAVMFCLICAIFILQNRRSQWCSRKKYDIQIKLYGDNSKEAKQCRRHISCLRILNKAYYIGLAIFIFVLGVGFHNGKL